jgi:hypothetical protein
MLDSVRFIVLSVSFAREREVCQRWKKVTEIHFPYGEKQEVAMIVWNNVRTLSSIAFTRMKAKESFIYFIPRYFRRSINCDVM